MSNQEPHINDYKDGLNKDFNSESFPKTAYEDAHNIRLFTDGNGASLGAIHNVTGNKKIAEIAVLLPELPFEIEIIGVCQLRDSLIVFLTENSTTEGGHGYIVELDFNFQTTIDTQTNASLIYDSDCLKFSKLHPIEAIAMHENANYERVYFTDYENPTKSINIRDGLVNTYHCSSLNFFPNPGVSRPIIENITYGGSLEQGIYSYAYYFTSAGGNTTVISPISTQIHIVKDGDNTEPTTNSYKGTPEGIVDEEVTTGKQVAVRIPLDALSPGTYETVSLIALHVSSFGELPIVTEVVSENILGNTNEIILVHSGTETGAQIVVFEEFITGNVPFKTNKTFGIKDNVLFCANIKGYDLNIPDDIKEGLKTYRYLQDSGSTHLDASGLPDVYNNPFNDESGSKFGQETADYTVWLNQYQYKYRENSSILGGNGEFINYKFTLERMEGDSSPNGSFSVASAYNQNQAFETIDLEDGTTYINKSFRNLASPYKRFLRGYKRGETYRFAIVFYNQSGAVSSAQYIGDIKFPEISDRCSSVVGTTYGGQSLYHFPVSLSRGYDGTTGSTDNPKYSDLYSLGLEFSVTLPEDFILNNNISHYQIVRCKRKDTDKTRIAQGVVSKWYVPANDPKIAADIVDDRKLFYPVAELQDIPGHLNRYQVNTGNEGSGPFDTLSLDEDGGEQSDLFEYGASNATPGGITGFNGILAPPNADSGHGFTMNPDINTDSKTGIGYSYDNASDRRNIIETSVTYQSAASSPNIVSFFCPEMTFNHFVPALLHGVDYLKTVGYLTYTTKFNRDSRHKPFGTSVEAHTYNITTSSMGVFTQWGHTFYSIEDGDRGTMEEATAISDVGETFQNNRKAYRPQLGAGNDSILDNSHANYPRYDDVFESGREIMTKAGQTSPLNCLTLHLSDHHDLHLSESNFEKIEEMKPMAPKTYANTPFTTVGSFKCRNLAYEVGNIHIEGAERTRMARHGTHLLCALGTPSQSEAWGTSNGSGQFIANDSRWGAIGGSHSKNLAGSAFLIDYVRRITGQYGGNGEQPVSSNTFFSTSGPIRLSQTDIDTEEISAIATANCRVFEGDIFVTHYKFFKNFWNWHFDNQMDFEESQEQEAAFNMSLSSTHERVSIPIETTINTELNAGEDGWEGGTFHPGDDPPTSHGLQEHKDYYGVTNTINNGTTKAFDYNPVFTEDQITKLHFTEPPGFKPTNSFDVRTYASHTKILGESGDSFTKFGLLSYRDLDPTYGPINRLINLKDELVSIQDDAIGVFLINTREMTTSESGSLVTLGTGEGVQDFNYITTKNGGIHQYAAVVSDGIGYILDAKRKALIILKGVKSTDLSKALGLNDYLNENIGGIMLLTKEQGGDNPLIGIGATMGYDLLNKEVLVSLFDNKVGYNLNNSYGVNAFTNITPAGPQSILFSSGIETFFFNGDRYTPETALQSYPTPLYLFGPGFDFTVLEDLNIEALIELPSDWKSLVKVAIGEDHSIPSSLAGTGGSTFVFSETVQKFTSFYSFLPKIYSNHNRNLFSSPLENSDSKLFIHNEGDYGRWYGQVSDTSISFIVNSSALINKILRFIEYNCIVEDENGNVTQSTGLNRIRIENDYQDSQELDIDQVHRFRKFRVKLPRDEEGGRFRGTFFKISLFFDNSVNLSLTLQRIISFFDIQSY